MEKPASVPAIASSRRTAAHGEMRARDMGESLQTDGAGGCRRYAKPLSLELVIVSDIFGQNRVGGGCYFAVNVGQA